MATVEIPCNFVGSFKVGDNLRYNCEVLCNLTAANAGNPFNKLIVLQVGAILEAALTQIIFRAQHFNLEGVPYIVEADRLKIEESKIDKFAVSIDVLRKYDVLNGLGADTYEEMHRLRKYRNKIHIQEDVSIQGASLEEDVLFSPELAVWALDLNRRTLQFLSENLPRRPHIHGYVGPLVIPA